MVKIFFVSLFWFLSVTSLYGWEFSEFVDTQLENYYKLNSDANITDGKIDTIITDQSKLYNAALYKLLLDKDKIIAKKESKYLSKIFTLQKRINVNKRAGNEYAVLRDKVKKNSYKILVDQHAMVRRVLMALDEQNLENVEKAFSEAINEHQNYINTLPDKEYDTYLKIPPENSKVIQQLQHNIKEYRALKEMSSDIGVYFYKLKKKMYRLNKYSKFHMMRFAYSLEEIQAVHTLNNWLEQYGIDIIKIMFMLFLVVVIYIVRRVFVRLLAYILYKIPYFQDHTELILNRLTFTIHALFIVINVNMIIYIYNDFAVVDVIAKLFNITYIGFITYIFYSVVNTVAAIELSKFDMKKTHIKSDVINVGLKIANFNIFLIGLLFALHFAGVNLTAVLSGLGIGGFALAFAAKDTISNFFGTIAVLVSDVFSQGDWIEIDGKEGTVVEIGLRVTTIRTFDNALIAIPNGTFASKDVKNWNKRKVGRRIKMSIGVKYDSKPSDIQNAVKQIRIMLEEHPGIASKETVYEHTQRHSTKLVSQDDLEGVKRILFVYVDEFADSSINILIYCFTTSVMWQDWLETKEDVMYKIMEILEQNSLEFAFPSLSVYKEK